MYTLKLSQICHTSYLVPMLAAHAIVAEYCVVIAFILFKSTESRLIEEPLQVNVVFGVKNKMY